MIKTFVRYIGHHRLGIMTFCLFTGVFSCIFYLYQLPVEAVAYAAFLCACIGLLIIAIDFVGYYRKHTLLALLAEKVLLDTQELPLPQNLIEQDYSAIVQTVHQDKIRIVSESDSNKSDMTEYYTLWVHQIKTPIAAMGLLLQRQNTIQSKELMLELFKIEQYVEMVLSYLRLDSAYTDFAIKNQDLDEIIKQAVRKYAPMFIRKKITLEYNNLDVMVLTDEKWLCFVIEQVLSNALKYTHRGSISIYLKENKTLVIEDTGIGIAQEDLPRLCEKGFTGYNGRADKKATGIGLYLCKRVLQKLSHTIAIESEIGVFTRVELGLDTVDIII